MRLRSLIAPLGAGLAAAVIALAPADGAQSTAGSFGPPQSLGVADVTSAVATGDFDADGRPDLVAAVPGAGRVAVRLGNGTGFGTPSAIDVPGAVDVASTDIDGDGFDDAVVAGSGGVTVLHGDGATGLADVASTSGVTPTGIAIGDVDLDGDDDVLAALGAGGVRLLRNRNGALTLDTTFAGAATRVLLADVNADLLPDLVTGAADELRVRLATGPAAFGPAATTTLTDAPADLASADLDGDGRNEIAAATGSGVVIANYTASLTASAPAAPSDAAAVAFADVDGDGDDDLLSSTAAAVAVRANDGNGTLGAPSTFAAGGATAGLAPLQLDDDGLPDLLVAGESLSLLRSAPGADLVTTATPDRQYVETGQVVTFAVRVRNDGGDPARAVELSLTAEHGTIGALPDGCGESSCDLGRVDAAGERTISVPVTAGAGDIVKLTAAATSLTPDASPADATGLGQATIGTPPTATPSPSPSPDPTETATATPTETATATPTETPDATATATPTATPARTPIASPTPTVAPPAPLVITLKAARTTRRVALSKGIAVTVACSGACAPTLTAKLGRKPVGTARASVPVAGSTVVRLKLSKRGRKAVRRAKKPKLKIAATGAAPITLKLK